MDIWRILAIEQTKDQDTIRNAYRQKLLTVHPEEDPEGFKLLRDAFEKAMVYANTPEEDENSSSEDENTVFHRVQKEAVKIYDNLATRINPECWMSLLAWPEFEELDTSDEAREALLVVFMNRIFLPREIWALVCKALLVKEEREQLVEKFNPDYIDYVIGRSEADDVIDFSLFENRKEHERLLSAEYLTDAPLETDLQVPTHPGFDSYEGDVDQYINALRFLWGNNDKFFTLEDPELLKQNAVETCSLIRYLESKDLWHPEEYHLKMRLYSFSGDPKKACQLAIPVLKKQADLTQDRLYLEASRVYLLYEENKDPELLREIEEQIDATLKENDQDYWALLNQILLFRALGRLEDAAEKNVDLLADFGENAVTVKMLKDLDEILVPKYEKLMEEDPDNDEYLICRVRYLGQLNRYEEALALLESREVSEEWKPDRNWFMSRALMVAGRNEEAYDYLHQWLAWMEPVVEKVEEMKARGEEPDHTTKMRMSRRLSAYGALGELCISLKKYDESVAAFRKLLTLDPNPRYEIPCTLGIIKNMEDTRQYYQAMKMLEDLVKKFGPDLDNLMTIHANNAYRISENQDVVDDYYRVIEVDPTHPRSYLLAFRVFMQYDQTEDAQGVIDRAKANNVSKLLTDYMDLGIKRAAVSNKDQALEVLDEMLEMRDNLIALKAQSEENEVFNLSDLRYNIANLAQQIQRNEGSCKIDYVEEAKQALKEKPELWDFTESCLLLIIKSMNQPDDPELLAMELAQTGVCDADIYYSLGLYYDQLRDPEKAVPCLEKAVEQSPYFSLALYRLMIQYKKRFLKLGNPEDLAGAERIADALVETEPTFSNFLEAADLYLYLEKFEKANAAYEQALEVKPEDYRPYNGLGLVAMDQKKYDLAVRNFQIAIARNAGRRNIDYIYQNLIKCYRRMGRYEDALNTWEVKASQYEPDSDDLEDKASILYAARRYQEGEQLYRSLLAQALKDAETGDGKKDWNKIQTVIGLMIRIYEAGVFLDVPKAELENRKKELLTYLSKNDLLLTPKKTMFGSGVRNTPSGKIYMEAKEKYYDEQTGRSLNWIYSDLALFFVYSVRDFQTAILYFIRWISYNTKDVSKCSNYDLTAMADRKNDLAFALALLGDKELAMKYTREAQEILLARYPEEVLLKYPGQGFYIGKALMQAAGIQGQPDFMKYAQISENCVLCDFCKHQGCYEQFLLIGRSYEVQGRFAEAEEYYAKAYELEGIDCEAKISRDICREKKNQK